MSRLYALVICLLLTAGVSYADDNPLNLLRDDVISYFTPVKGNIVSVSEGRVIADIGAGAKVKKGMRFTVFREGAPFLHPVTKEPIGKLESVTGKVEVADVGADTSTMTILKGDVRASDRIRISETPVRMLFYQGKNVEWGLAESYYRTLKDTGRFELIDTAVETENEAEIIAEAKRLNADVAIILSARDAGGDTMLGQKLVWVDDSVKFAEAEARIAVAFMKEVKFGEEFFGPQKSDARLYVDLPFGVRIIAYGDIDGDGKTELIMSTGKDIRFYALSGSVYSSLAIKGSVLDDHIWLDAMDINRDGKDEIMVTFLKDDRVISRIYELKEGRFHVLWEGNVFLRRMGKELFAQSYAAGEGYRGPVFIISLDNGYKKGNNITLPKDVNIYDFVYISESDGRRLVLAYDNEGYLNLYDDNASRLWKSKEDFGGFNTSFKITPRSGLVEAGEWYVKDRLVQQNRKVFVIKRIPFIGMAKGMGYRKSQIKSLWWTGVSMEERNVVEDISGNALDYALIGDRLIVLSKPAFGIKLDNILKGGNPLGGVLYIYSLTGR